MPTFFNKNELTDEQKSRWDFCIQKYSEIQEKNFQRELQNVSEYQKKKFKKERGKDIIESMREFQKCMSQPGDSKSALFNRLLSGKEALDYPPPTAFSYPWYDVIEKNEPLQVMINQYREKNKKYFLINQCPWNLKNQNEAGKLLLEANDKLQSGWNQELLDEVISLYLKDPMFTVQYGNYGNYKISLKSSVCQGLFGYSKEEVTLKRIENMRDVLDAHWLKINCTTGKILSKGIHPKTKLAEAQERAKNIIDRDPTAEFSVQIQLQSLEKDVIEFEENPEDFDWIEIFYDTWHIEKL